MYILINNKKIKLLEANSVIKRFKGFMLKKNINYALRFKCNGIHTFFMKEKIDVILTDKDNNIIKIYKNLNKNRIVLPKKNVYFTYELPNNSIISEIKKIDIIKEK